LNHSVNPFVRLWFACSLFVHLLIHLLQTSPILVLARVLLSGYVFLSLSLFLFPFLFKFLFFFIFQLTICVVCWRFRWRFVLVGWRFVFVVLCSFLCFCVCVFVFVCLCFNVFVYKFFFFLFVNWPQCIFFLLLLSIVSVVVSVVCMCSCDWGLYLRYCPPVFWFFVWWTFDMFRRWYYVVCLGCLLYWVLVYCGVCVILSCKRGCCVWYWHIRMWEMCVSVCDVCVCVIRVLCKIFVLSRWR